MSIAILFKRCNNSSGGAGIILLLLFLFLVNNYSQQLKPDRNFSEMKFKK